MYNALNHAHSGIRWIALFLLIATVLISVSKMMSSSKSESASLKKIFTFNVAFIHIQALIGIVLLFLSAKVSFAEGWMKGDLSRFYGLEHPLAMLVVVVLVTIGNAKAKRKTDLAKKYKTLFIYNLLALLIVLAMIPWPFREGLGGAWF